MKSTIRTRGIPFSAMTASTEPSIANLYWPIRNVVSEDFLARHVKSTHSKKWEGLMFLSTKYKIVVVRREAPYKDELFKNCFNSGEATTDLPINDEYVAEIETLFKNTLAFEFKKFSSYVEVIVTAERWTVSVAVGLSKLVSTARARKLPKKPAIATGFKKQAPTLTPSFLTYPYSSMVLSMVGNQEFEDDINAIVPINISEIGTTIDSDSAGWAVSANVINRYAAGVLKVLRKHIWVKKMGMCDADFRKILDLDENGLQDIDSGHGSIQDLIFACALMKISPQIPIQIAEALFINRRMRATTKS